MAEIPKYLDNIIKNRALIISKIFHPKNLKKTILIGLIIIFVIITIFIILNIVVIRRPYSIPYQYVNLPSLKFTSDFKVYGSFFFSGKVHLEHHNKDVADELDNRGKEVSNIIMNIISGENYYMINSVEKRRHYLAHRVKERLNLFLQTSGGVSLVDFYLVRLKLNKSKDYKKNTYYSLGTFISDFGNKSYKFEIYIVYDGSSVIFNKLLKGRHDELVNQIKIRLESIKFRYANYDITSLKDELILVISEEVRLFLSSIEDGFSNMYPLYEKKDRLQDLLFTLFRPYDEEG